VGLNLGIPVKKESQSGPSRASASGPGADLHERQLLGLSMRTNVSGNALGSAGHGAKQ